MKQVPLALDLDPPVVDFPSTRQVPLALGLEPPRLDFASFVPDGNEALLQHLQQPGRLRAPVYLWGPRGCGKTHLLQAWLRQCRQRGGRSGTFEGGAVAPPAEGTAALAASGGVPEVDAAWHGLVVDDVHRLDAAG